MAVPTSQLQGRNTSVVRHLDHSEVPSVGPPLANYPSVFAVFNPDFLPNVKVGPEEKFSFTNSIK
jgi:hypothetical protein